MEHIFWQALLGKKKQNKQKQKKKNKKKPKKQKTKKQNKQTNINVTMYYVICLNHTC